MLGFYHIDIFTHFSKCPVSVPIIYEIGKNGTLGKFSNWDVQLKLSKILLFNLSCVGVLTGFRYFNSITNLWMFNSIPKGKKNTYVGTKQT